MNLKSRSTLLIILTILLSLNFHYGTSIVNNNGETPVKNVIIMIGDGMGFEHVRYGSLVEYGIQNGFSFQSSNFTQHQIYTASASEAVTDSAASATAIATGYKTRSGYLGIDIDKIPRETILEYAESLGYSTGLVTSTEFNHGTPGGFGSHVDNRDDWEKINHDYYENDIEILMGGGSQQIITENITSVQGVLDMYNYTHITTKDELLTLNTTLVEKLLGTFSPYEFDYEANLNPTTDVHFADMVLPALEILSKNQNGFFVMFEEGHIDKAGHAAIASGPLPNPLETIEFDEGIKIVMDWMKDHPDTLLIVTADHETGGLEVYNWDNLDNDLPGKYESEDDKLQRRLDRAGQINFKFTTSGHTGVPVPLHLYGKNADLLVSDNCIYNNAHIYQIMKNAMDGTYPTQCPAWIPGFGDTETGPAEQHTFGYISDPITPVTSSEIPSSTPDPSNSDDSSTIQIMFFIISLMPIISKLQRKTSVK